MTKLAVATVALAVTLSASATAAPRIVGGTDTPITDVPWQVLVNLKINNMSGFCGGSILDPTHVLTAAHCVHSDDSNPQSALFPTGAFTIVAGSSNLNPYSPLSGNPPLDSTNQVVGVAGIVADARWNGADFDTAVLTVSPAFVLDGTSRRAATLASAAPATGAGLMVSGWGLDNASDQNSANNVLQRTTVNVTDFTACNQAYNNVFSQATVLCAIAPGHDACFGDSGGPLVDGSGALVGVVSSGPDNACADLSHPGVYTSVSDCRVRSFITSQFLGAGPQSCTPPVLGGTPAIGQVLQCASGTWSGTPVFNYTFINQPTNSDLQASSSNSYTVTAADVGRSIACRVTAQDATGTQSATSNTLGAVPPPPDVTAPRARVVSDRCTRTQCILHVTASDPGSFPSGIASLIASRRTTTTRPCAANPRRTCSHTTTRNLTSRKTSAGYTITASNLPYGTQRFSIQAVDKAGNKQRTPTTSTRTTHRPARR